ncbi:Uncharacterized protein ehr_00022 [Ehrlichia minasensis]|nr:Uncharacterized protein ehr_00022 [Ehrlichia minasensis]
MLGFLKKGASVIIKAAVTPTTSKLPHQESVGKHLEGMLKSVVPGQKSPREKNFDLKMHDRTYKLGIELPGRTRVAGHETDVAFKIPSYKLPYQALQKFAVWQEQDKEGEVEETRKGALASLLTPIATTRGLISSKIADQYFQKLKELDSQLKPIGGKVILDSTAGSYKHGLTIELDVSGKSREQIEKEVKIVLQSLGITDSKLAKTFSQRLYKVSTDPKVSSADIQDTKSHTDTDNKGKTDNKDIVSSSPTQNSDIVSSAPAQNSDVVSSGHDPNAMPNSDFSLTNPRNMPYNTRGPSHSSEMLQKLQQQILMQQKPEPLVPQHMSPSMQQAIEEIAEGLQSNINDEPTQSSPTNPGITNTGKVHARR